MVAAGRLNLDETASVLSIIGMIGSILFALKVFAVKRIILSRMQSETIEIDMGSM